MNALLSIKPQHVSNIFSGEKRFEFRRRIFSRQDVQTVVVYASRPIDKVVGEFEIDGIITAPIAALWAETAQYAGISESYFLSYFRDRAVGHAIRIGKIHIYSQPLCLSSIEINLKPPQSFMYINKSSQTSVVGGQEDFWP